MNKILTDVFMLDNIQVLSEGKNGSTMKIRGVFQRADEANANKRIYSKQILENSIKSLKPMLENRMLVGELDHPEANNVRLSNASHLITGLKMVGKDMIGEAEILNTPAGKIAQTLINDKVKIGISSRGTGTISEDKDGVKHVNEDFRLVTFDLVADPSTRGAYPGVTESKKLDMDAVIKKTFGEKVLIALLRENFQTEKDKAKPDGEKKEDPKAKAKSYWASRKERDKRFPINRKQGYTGSDLSKVTDSKEQDKAKVFEQLKTEILKRSRIKKD